MAPTEEQIVISCIATDPLWHLAFLALDEENTDPTKIRILAGLMPPITEQEKKRVVRFLRGTTKPVHEAIQELKLPHPPSYVQEQISPRLRWHPGSANPDDLPRWESVGAIVAEEDNNTENSNVIRFS
jgi:hypothetical protein